MAKYPFLSDEWVAEARRIYADAGANGDLPVGAAVAPVRVNLIVTQAPFSGAPIDAHVDTSTGRFAIDTGHLEGPDVTVSLDYATARSLFVAGDVQSVMQAFLSGRIRVDGDLSKLLDPRSGIWPGRPASAPPGSAAATTTGPGADAGGAAPGGAAPGGPGGREESGGLGPPEGNGDLSGAAAGATGGAGPTGLSFAYPEALRVANRLQEITE